MKVKLRNNKERGVALAFALMTVLLLMTLSTTVVGLSMRHARSGVENDFTQEALYAADWYTNAALDYLKQPGAVIKTSPYGFDNPYADTVTLATSSSTPKTPSTALNRSDVSPHVEELSDSKLGEYGLDPANSNKGYLLRFSQDDDNPLVYFPQNASDPTAAFVLDDSFAVCDVAIEKVEPKTELYNTKTTPGYYHLVIHSRVYDGSMKKTIADIQKTAKSKVGIDEYPKEGLLATRVIDVQARIESPLDYLHIIQDGRSWRAQGLNLDGGSNSLFDKFLSDTSNYQKYLDNGLNICGFPDGYEENGKLRIDGGTRMGRSQIENVYGANTKHYIDGSANFFGSAHFNDEFTQRYSSNSISYAKNLGSLENVFEGGMNDNQDSIGLPQSGDNANYNSTNGKRISVPYNERKTYQQYAREIGKTFTIGGTPGSNTTNNVVAIGSKKINCTDKDLANTSWVPDVYSAGSETDVRPSFAKYVITLGEHKKSADASGTNDCNYITITKENPGLPGHSQYIGSYKIGEKNSPIKNGVIAVQGGNVEVRSKMENDGKTPVNFNQEITIVADVEATREDSLNYFNAPNSNYEGIKRKNGTTVSATAPSTIRANNKNSLYSDGARQFFDEHPKEYFDTLGLTGNDRVMPPYSCKKLYEMAEKDSKLSYLKSDPVIKAHKDDDKAYIWPTPTSEATEREGNIFITSDIKCGTAAGQRGAVGIVAKNYVSLNDKTVAKKPTTEKDYQSLNIEAMLFSFDKSVQFDWTNDAGNPNFSILKTNAKKRQFNLVGCVVSSNLDIEGSDEGVGYLKQKELSNISLKNMPPYIPAYSEGEGRWVIISYKDTGVRNWF